MYDDMTYSMLHEMIKKKFNLEAIYPVNFSVKLSSFDSSLDITDENEPDILETPLYKSNPMISKHYNKQTEVEVGNIFDNKEALDLDIRLKALDDGYQLLPKKSAPKSLVARVEVTRPYVTSPSSSTSSLILTGADLKAMVPLSNLITALAIVRNGVPKMKGLFSFSLMSKITKSTG
ncbi:hypothetical protein Tco_1549460 [Tanacetum coccineum]